MEAKMKGSAPKSEKKSSTVSVGKKVIEHRGYKGGSSSMGELIGAKKLGSK